MLLCCSATSIFDLYSPWISGTSLWGWVQQRRLALETKAKRILAGESLSEVLRVGMWPRSGCCHTRKKELITSRRGFWDFFKGKGWFTPHIREILDPSHHHIDHRSHDKDEDCVQLSQQVPLWRKNGGEEARKGETGKVGDKNRDCAENAAGNHFWLLLCFRLCN